MIPVILEVGARRTFASGEPWPGWTRSGRDADAALATLAAYEVRYATVLERAGFPWEPASALEVVETIPGNATTDFGAPSMAGLRDRSALDPAEGERIVTIWRACWAALDRAAAGVRGELRKGPRGGGRSLAAILAHVSESDGAYARKLRLRLGAVKADDPGEVAAYRDAMVTAVRAETKPAEELGAGWTAAYLVRRSAWHALDHAWEIEDRSSSESR